MSHTTLKALAALPPERFERIRQKMHAAVAEALAKMDHAIANATDGPGGVVRTIFREHTLSLLALSLYP